MNAIDIILLFIGGVIVYFFIVFIITRFLSSGKEFDEYIEKEMEKELKKIREEIEAEVNREKNYINSLKPDDPELDDKINPKPKKKSTKRIS
jgi:predicted PurR-regulated permease PerM